LFNTILFTYSLPFLLKSGTLLPPLLLINNISFKSNISKLANFKFDIGGGAGEGVGVTDGVKEGDGLGVFDGDTEGVGWGVLEGVLEGVFEGVNDGEGVGDTVGVTELVGVTDGVGNSTIISSASFSVSIPVPG